MSVRPRVSVVMANHNGARYIAAAVRSVLDQSLSDLELLLVDDASTDGSVDQALAAAGGDRRLKVLAQPVNRGPGAARNRALAQASGAWIAICDSDDLMAHDRLETLLGSAEREGLEMIADNLLEFADGCEFQPRPLLPLRDPLVIGLADFAEANQMYAKTPTLGYVKPLIRAAALDDIRYDESLRIGEDYDLLARLMARGRALRIEPVCLYRYRKHAGSVSHRLAPSHLVALLDADTRFRAGSGPFDPPSTAALDRRRSSLERALAYELVIADLKGGAYLRGLARALANPPGWPLLTMPLAARWARLLGRRGAR